MERYLRFRWLVGILVLFGLLSTSAASDLLRTTPHPSLSPLDVVVIVMNALQHNDTPDRNRGISVTFNFASPANKRVTGPLMRFVTMVRGPVYGKMIGHQGATYENVEIEGDNARIDVIIKARGRKYLGFRFLLSRQRHNQFNGSWMTDSVIPIEVVSS